MFSNVGGMDRGIRIVLAIALFALAFLHVITGTWAIVAYVVGAVALVTGIVRFCPAWSLFRINTSTASHK